MNVRSDIRAQGVLYFTLDSPDTRNAMGDELLDELLSCHEAARADDSIRVVVLTSSHEHIFSAGGDLKAFGDDRPLADKYRGPDRFPRLFTLLAISVNRRSTPRTATCWPALSASRCLATL